MQCLAVALSVIVNAFAIFASDFFTHTLYSAPEVYISFGARIDTERFIYLRHILRVMLSKELREKLIEAMKKDPKEAMKEIEKDPRILELLLNNDREAEMEKSEKIKYVNMTYQMQNKLAEEAKKLNTTQGLLIGAGILLLLSLLDKE